MSGTVVAALTMSALAAGGCAAAPAALAKGDSIYILDGDYWYKHVVHVAKAFAVLTWDDIGKAAKPAKR